MLHGRISDQVHCIERLESRCGQEMIRFCGMCHLYRNVPDAVTDVAELYMKQSLFISHLVRKIPWLFDTTIEIKGQGE